eukprot:37454-Heterocapsa_arctica.AAC.1
MALFPTEAEALAMADLTAVRAWVGVSPVAWNAFTLQIGDPGGPIRNLAMLPHSIVHAAISSTVVNTGTPPTPRDFTAVEAAQ